VAENHGVRIGKSCNLSSGKSASWRPIEINTSETSLLPPSAFELGWKTRHM
jgi:hypothetical protein